tara:strand:+ start:1128 stop:1301 length:174 start_codon:yes stop_codon:yes gene_type:complete
MIVNCPHCHKDFDINYKIKNEQKESELTKKINGTYSTDEIIQAMKSLLGDDKWNSQN